MTHFSHGSSALRGAGIGLAVFLLAAGVSAEALAGSPATCATLSDSGSLTVGNTSSGVSANLDAGDTVYANVTHASPVYSTALLVNGNPVDTVSAQSDHLTYTINSAGTYSINLNAGGSDVTSYTIGCTPGSSPTTETTGDNSAAYADVVRSVSLSQTGVLEKNLDSRIDAAFQAAGARLDSGIGTEAASGFAGLAAALRQQADDPFAWDDDDTSSRKSGLRELAMLGSFDSSRMVLAAAGTDAEPDATKGVGSRADQRQAGPLTLWGHGSYVNTDNDISSGEYSGDSWGYTMGLDYRARPDLVAGLSVGYGETDFDTAYNAGSYDETGWNLAPYVIYHPMDGLTLSAVAGYGQGDVDRVRDGSVTGDTESSQWFAALRANYTKRPFAGVPLDLSGRVSFTAARKQIDAFTESDGSQVGEETANMRRLKPGVEAAYSVPAGQATLQPFVKADYIYDFTDPVNNDKQAYNLGGGLRVNSGTTGFAGSVSAERQFGRSDYGEYSIDGQVSYNFAIKRSDGTQATLAPFMDTSYDAEDGQSFGTGLKYSDPAYGVTGSLGVSHDLYTYEDDDDTEISTRATVAKVTAGLTF